MEHGRIISREPGLTVCELSGTPYEMGVAHGRLFAPEIALMRARLLSYLHGISFGVGGRALMWLFGLMSRRMEPFTPEPLKQEMRGIAAGSGLNYRFIFLLNSLDDMLVNMACSCVAAGPERTADGSVIIGRNLDYPLFYDVLPGLTTVFKLEPQDGRPFVSVAWPGFSAVVTGMNDMGVFLADLTSISRDKRLSGTPALLLNRMALQGSSTLDGLIDKFSDARRTVGKNIMAASPMEARVIELNAIDMEVRSAEDGLLVCTNHFESPSLAKRQGSIKPPPKSDFSAAYYSYAFSKQRMDSLSSGLAGVPKLGVDEIISALGKDPVANESTVQSVVFMPASLRILVAASGKTPASHGTYRELAGLLKPGHAR